MLFGKHPVICIHNLTERDREQNCGAKTKQKNSSKVARQKQSQTHGQQSEINMWQWNWDRTMIELSTNKCIFRKSTREIASPWFWPLANQPSYCTIQTLQKSKPGPLNVNVRNKNTDFFNKGFQNMSDISIREKKTMPTIKLARIFFLPNVTKGMSWWFSLLLPEVSV